MVCIAPPNASPDSLASPGKPLTAKFPPDPKKLITVTTSRDGTQKFFRLDTPVLSSGSVSRRFARQGEGSAT